MQFQKKKIHENFQWINCEFGVCILAGKLYSIRFDKFNPFVHNAPFLYTLKTSENLVFRV